MDPKITPFLWFEAEAEEAANLYVDVFGTRRMRFGGGGDSKILDVSRYGEAGPGTPGTVLTMSFLIDGVRFVALNGGPGHPMNDSVSFVVDCQTQDEVDYLWDALTADGGEEGPCAWLKDRFGVWWQIVPRRLMELLGDPDPERARRATEAMLQMKKIDIAELERAADAA
jgi:predicted 3-demethylubiquinone-9 3-methyltransferase (glyoxalase superfamily)